MTAFPTNEPYTVTVEVRRDGDGVPFVVGVAVRRQFPWWEEDGWNSGDERPNVSPRDVQRLPLSKIVRAALAAASTAERPTLEGGQPVVSEVASILAQGDERAVDWDWADAARNVLTPLSKPLGKPQHGKSTEFYRRLADDHRAFALAGKSPVQEIARREGVSPNTVHQWVHRARRLDFLEPSPRAKPTRKLPQEED